MGNTFKENLREELDFQDMTIKELSEKTGISKRSIDNYLSKRESIPPADYAVKIALVLGLTVEQLVSGKDSQRNYNLTLEDKHFIETFRKLPKQFQETLKSMIESSVKK